MDGYIASAVDGVARINDLAVDVPGVVMQRFIDDGANGIVFAATDELGRKVAVNVACHWAGPPLELRTVRVSRPRQERHGNQQLHRVDRDCVELRHRRCVRCAEAEDGAA